MFPEAFVQRNLLSWSEPLDLVLDPFCGRGTTVFESLLNRRGAIGCDTNEVAVCVSKAKVDIPPVEQVLKRIDELRFTFDVEQVESHEVNREFFSLCYDASTLQQILFLRRSLAWKRSRVDCFIAALCLGALHGEGHRSSNCLSNRMPRTISTKPNYSVKWWRHNGYTPPKRDVFSVLESLTLFRFAAEIPHLRGKVRMGDARKVSEYFPEALGKVRLVITSPPYLDITDYREDQWLRLWFLGGKPFPASGGKQSDDRHRRTAAYWSFLKEVWTSVAPLLNQSANIVIRIGGTRLSRDEIEASLSDGLREAVSSKIKLAEVSSSVISRGQRQSFTPQSRLSVATEHDFRFYI